MPRIFPTLAALCLATAAQAQEEKTVVDTAWQVFRDRCGLALADPGAFLTSLPATNYSGAPAMLRSPDDRLVATSSVHDGLMVDARIFAANPGRYLITCTVSPYFDTPLPDIDIAALNQALADHMAADGIPGPFGGNIAPLMAGEEDGPLFLYFTEMDIAGTPVPVRIEAIPYGLSIGYDTIAAGG